MVEICEKLKWCRINEAVLHGILVFGPKNSLPEPEERIAGQMNHLTCKQIRLA